MLLVACEVVVSRELTELNGKSAQERLTEVLAMILKDEADDRLMTECKKS
jgi:hypothetical protein